MVRTPAESVDTNILSIRGQPTFTRTGITATGVSRSEPTSHSIQGGPAAGAAGGRRDEPLDELARPLRTALRWNALRLPRTYQIVRRDHATNIRAGDCRLR